MQLRSLVTFSTVALLGLGYATQATADTWTPFYDATITSSGPGGNPDVLRMKSDSASMPSTPYAYLRYIPTTSFQLQSLTTLSADFSWLQGSYHGGSPRFDLGLDMDNSGTWDGGVNDRLLYVYWGTPPNFTDSPAAGWQNTGNLMTDGATRFDLQSFGGPYIGTAAQAMALLGTKNVLRAYVSLDAGWGGAQWMDVDYVNINGSVYDAQAIVPLPAAALMGFPLIGLVAGAGYLRRRKMS